jgi:hypothetical protein
VVIYIKERAVVVLPDKEVDLGNIAPNDHIMVARSRQGVWQAYVQPA